MQKQDKNSFIIAGNWKMNGLLTDGKKLIEEVTKFSTDNSISSKVIIAPPFTLLHPLSEITKPNTISLCAQDCSFMSKGAYTGCISPDMLKDAGCEYVITGHSERRILHKETSEVVRKKANAAHETGLKVIICVGETAEERQAGNYFEVIADQIANSVPATATGDNTVIAYEPVWAIGSGKNAEKEEISEMHNFIAGIISKNFTSLSEGLYILYGGSVKSSNAVQILDADNVGGLLVGGASLNAIEFCKIIEVAEGKW